MSALVAEFFFQPSAVFLNAVVPLDVIEGAIAVEIVLDKFAIVKFAFDELAASKRRAAEFAFFEFHIDQNGAGEETTIPFAFLKSTADKNGIDKRPFQVHVTELAELENVIGPAVPAFQSCLKLFGFEMHDCDYAASPNSANNSA